MKKVRAPAEFFWLRYLPKIFSLWISARPSLIKILDSFGWLIFDKLFRLGIGLLITAWIARYLGPQQFGLFTYCLAFVSVFGAIATLGLYSVVVRDIAQNPAEDYIILGSSFFLRLLGGFIAYSLCIISIIWLRAGDNETILIVLILATTLIFQSSSVIQWNFEAKLQSKYVVWPQSIAFAVVAMMKITMVYAGSPLIYFVYATVFEALLSAIGLALFYVWHSNKVQKWHLDYSKSKEILKISWPIMFVDILNSLQGRVDLIMLGNIGDKLQLGFYSAALTITEAFGFLAAILWITLGPLISKSKIISSTLYRVRLLNFYRLNFLVFILIEIFLILFGSYIVNKLYGPSFTPAKDMLILMSMRIFYLQMGMARSAFLVNEGMFKYSLFTILIGTIIGFLLNLYLIPIYQSYGAIYSMIVSYFITFFLIDFFYPPARKNMFIMIEGVLSFYKISNVKNLK